MIFIPYFHYLILNLYLIFIYTKINKKFITKYFDYYSYSNNFLVFEIRYLFVMEIVPETIRSNKYSTN